MTIKDLFTVCSNSDIGVLIRDTDGIPHNSYKCVPDIEEPYTHCNVTDWFVSYCDRTIVVTVDANNFDR